MIPLPELQALEKGRSVVRIPPETDVPITPRVRRLIDTAPFRRLQRISQLGLVSQVYPGATHSRFEHSLGVYRLALLYLKSLQYDHRFAALVDPASAELFLVAALLHDVGHWPFCHAIEDIRLPQVRRHEELANSILLHSEISQLLRADWKLDPQLVADFLAGKLDAPHWRLLSKMLSGPIDVDKLDYLDRDSLHAGVPYGRNFDRQRLIQALCVGSTGCELAITEKGKTAAEMMVFARYIMFSEVYWHHTVRSATAMLQRAIFELPDKSPLSDWMLGSEADMIQALLAITRGTPTESLTTGLFGPTRRLYKRVAQFHLHEHPELHTRLARRPYAELVALARELTEHLAARLQTPLPSTAILIDAPPVKLEVQFHVEVMLSDGNFLGMGQVSPVVKALALQQFDDVVKRVRIFIDPEFAPLIAHLSLPSILESMLSPQADR